MIIDEQIENDGFDQAFCIYTQVCTSDMVHSGGLGMCVKFASKNRLWT